MPDDRRSAPRARLTGVHIVYGSASGETQDAAVLDIGRGGLFVRTAAPLAVGKRLSLEIAVAGESASWPALGRVVWIREADEGEERPGGMGVKLIDVEDEVLAAIDRLVAARERTEPGMGSNAPAPPAPAAPPPPRERTILGVGLSADVTRPTPVVAVVPGYTAIGEAPPDAPAQPAATGEDRSPEAVPANAAPVEPTGPDLDGLGREASLAIDLVSKKPSSRPPEPVPASEAPRKTGGAGVYLVMLVVAAAVAAYVFRERLTAEWDARFGGPAATPSWVAPPSPTPTPSPSPAPSPSPTPTPASPTPSASAFPSASASASASPSASTSAGALPKKALRPPAAPAHRPVQDESPY
ncbi:MAG TPA: PilZ domain-containing protein [Polyangiaceae bacterium]|nr:PilZ domain-containing protein [Polyangiaceae bacterium]